MTLMAWATVRTREERWAWWNSWRRRERKEREAYAERAVIDGKGRERESKVSLRFL